MLRIELAVGQSVSIGDIATVTLEEKSGKRARLAFKADKSVPIRRLDDAMQPRHVAANGLSGLPLAN